MTRRNGIALNVKNLKEQTNFIKTAARPEAMKIIVKIANGNIIYRGGF